MKRIVTFILLVLTSMVYASVSDTISYGGVQYVVSAEDSASNTYEVKLTNYLASRIVLPDSVVHNNHAYYITGIPGRFDSKTCRLTHYSLIDYSQCAHITLLGNMCTRDIDIDTLILPPNLQKTRPNLFFAADSSGQKPIADPDKMQPGIHRIFSSGNGNPNLSIIIHNSGALQEVDFSSYTVPIEEKYCFSHCYFLEKCILPNSYKNLKLCISSLFTNDMRLTCFNMPDSLMYLEPYFAAGVPISHFHIGPILDSITLQALWGWEYMDSVSVDARNKTYCAVDGVLFSHDTTQLLHYPYSRNADTYILPRQTKCIYGMPFGIDYEREEYAKIFRHHLKLSAGSLRTLVINDDLESIRCWSGFSKSNIRKLVNLENSKVWFISADCFNGSRIDSVKLPATIKIIGGNMIDPTSIVGFSFKNMSYLRCVDFSRADSLHLLGSGTFENDIHLDSINLLHCALLTEIKESTCKADSGLRYAALPRYISKIGVEAFSGCVSLNKLICPAFTPIRITSEMKVFEGLNTSACELVVPRKSVPLYQQAQVWQDFQISSDGLYTIEGLSSDTLVGAVLGTGAYLQGEVATLKATAIDGYEFTEWSDGNTENPRQVAATQDTTLVAFFQLISGLMPTTNNPDKQVGKYIKDGKVYIRQGENSYSILGEKTETNK